MAKKGKTPELPQILRWLSVLDHNDMNHAKTARECGIARSTLIRYREKYWEVYLEERQLTKQEAKDIAVKKTLMVKELEEVRKTIIDKAFTPVVNELNARLSEPETLKKIPFKLLIEGFRELAPYVAEKQGTLGVNVPNSNDPAMKHTSVIQNIISSMSIRSD